MTGYLFDTNVISLFAPSRKEHHAGLVEWTRDQDAQGLIYLSAVTIQEIEKGIRLLEARGAEARVAAYEVWLTGLIDTFRDRILSVDTSVAKVAGRLEALAQGSGNNPGAADAMIAATASCNNLTVVTANLKHFEAFQIRMLSPDQLL